jgi:hypothetical protein
MYRMAGHRFLSLMLLSENKRELAVRADLLSCHAEKC